jgi:hypothetical protein
MIKRYVTVFTLLGLFLVASPQKVASEGKAGKFGLGFELGDPTGFNAKYWLTNLTAFDFVVGWNSWGGYGNGPQGYNDSRCYGDGFYRDNRNYCLDGRYNYYDRYDEAGWDIFHFHADYLIHNFNVIHASIPIGLFYGFGVQYEYWRRYYYANWVAARGSFGVDFTPKTIPFDFFFELAPVFYIIGKPQNHFDVNGGIGARFWF